MYLQLLLGAAECVLSGCQLSQLSTVTHKLLAVIGILPGISSQASSAHSVSVSATFWWIQGLLNIGGNSTYTQRIAVHYQEPAFCRAWASASQKLAEQAPHDQHLRLNLRSDELVCVSQLLQLQGPIKCLTVTSLNHRGTPQLYSTAILCCGADCLRLMQ